MDAGCKVCMIRVGTEVFPRLAYDYGRIGQTEDAQRFFDDYERLLPEFLEQVGESKIVLYMAMAFAYLAIGEDQKAVDALEELAAVSNGLQIRVHEFAVNSWSDPVLDQPEFAEVRERLRYKEQ